MKMNRVVMVFMACALAAPAAAQKRAADVTEAQISEYKRTAEGACRDSGKQKGDSEPTVDAFCGCLMETLNKSISAAEWRQIVFYARAKQAEDERRTLAPHLKNLEACRPKAP